MCVMARVTHAKHVVCAFDERPRTLFGPTGNASPLHPSHGSIGLAMHNVNGTCQRLCGNSNIQAVAKPYSVLVESKRMHQHLACPTVDHLQPVAFAPRLEIRTLRETAEHV